MSEKTQKKSIEVLRLDLTNHLEAYIENCITSLILPNISKLRKLYEFKIRRAGKSKKGSLKNEMDDKVLKINLFQHLIDKYNQKSVTNNSVNLPDITSKLNRNSSQILETDFSNNLTDLYPHGSSYNGNESSNGLVTILENPDIKHDSEIIDTDLEILVLKSKDEIFDSLSESVIEYFIENLNAYNFTYMIKKHRDEEIKDWEQIIFKINTHESIDIDVKLQLWEKISNDVKDVILRQKAFYSNEYKIGRIDDYLQHIFIDME